jgi:hypothetical protein
MELKIDFSDIEQLARDLDVAATQVPFACAKVLNDGAFITRDVLTKTTWPRHVQQRSHNFPSAVLHVEKATKSNLSVWIIETPSTTAPLIDHAEGGVRFAKSKFAIPLPDYRVGRMTATHGLRHDARLEAVIKKYPKRALRITERGVFVGEHGRLRQLFAFKPSVTMHKDVPFEEDFVRTMLAVIQAELIPALIYAMRTRFG